MTKKRNSSHRQSTGGWNLVHLAVNVGVGLFIAILLALAGLTDWGEDLSNQAFDAFIRSESAGYAKKTTDLRSSSVFFVEIDKKLYRAMGEPLFTSRKMIADIVRAAWEREAAAVVIDVLLEKSDPTDADGEERLRGLMEKMLRENARTHVIFPVTLNSDGEIRPNRYDNVIDRRTASGERIFHRALPFALATASDLRYRYWSPYEFGVGRDGHPRILWSVPLLTAAILERKQESLYEQERSLMARKGNATVAHADGIELGRKKVKIPPLEWMDESHAVRPGARGEIDSYRIRFHLVPDTPSTYNLRVDAAGFLRGAGPLPAGKAVLFGNTSRDSGDFYMTPIGSQPGLYILGNAINTIAGGHAPAHLNPFLHYLIELGVILVAAFLFLRLPTLVAQVVASIVFLAALLPISWLIFSKWGLLLNFITPVVGMRLHTIASGCENALVYWRRKPQFGTEGDS